MSSAPGGADPSAALHRARVLIVGLTPWGVVAAADLAAAGVAALHLVDDATVTDGDLADARIFSEADRGQGRAEALGHVLSRTAPACRISSEPLTITTERGLVLGEDRHDLVLACVPGDDLLVLEGVARFAHAAGTISVSAYPEGLDAVVGPAVVPGRTACFRCARARRLATSAQPRLVNAIHTALLERRAAPRARAYPAPAAGALGHALALAAMDLLTARETSPLAGRIAVRSLVDLAPTLHAVLPMPSCDLCGGAPAIAPDPAAASVRLDAAGSPEALRWMLAGVLDARTGIVKSVVVASHDSQYNVELPVTSAAVLGTYSPCALHAHAPSPDDGYGKGITAVEAMIGAVGEAVERYAARWFDPGKIVRAPAADLAADFIPPERLNLYADHQYAEAGFPYPKVGPATPIDWTLGRWLDTGAPVYLPALLTYYDYHAPPEEQLCQVTSNGLAAGPTIEDASLRAALELLERDAFTLTWLARLPARRIRLDDAVDPMAREVDRRLVEDAGAGGRSALYLLDVGAHVPVVLAVLFGDGVRWPGASIAIAAHLSPRAAIRKVIFEQAQSGFFYRRLLEEGKGTIPARPEDVVTLEDHARYYFPKERAGAFAFLDGGGEVAAADLAEPDDLSLAALVRHLDGVGIRIAVADVTSPDLAGTPFRVARALGPDLQQIHFGHRLPRLGSPRLRALAPRGINPDPHPLD